MAARSGQITVTTAGTAVAGPDISGIAFLIKPHPDNVGDTIWMGNDGAGDVTNANGFPLATGENGGLQAAEPNQRINLNSFWFDAEFNGDKVCWLRIL